VYGVNYFFWSEFQQQIAVKTVKLTVCSRDNRLKWLDDGLKWLRRVIDARGKDMADVPVARLVSWSGLIRGSAAVRIRG
jgi:hypothetical protein